VKKIIIETDDQTYAAAISALCYVAGFQSALANNATDAEKYAEKETAAKAKLVDMIGQAINVDQKRIADATIAATLSAMNTSTVVTVE